MSSLNANVLAECEKNIQIKLLKLKEFQKNLEIALAAIQKVNQIEDDFEGSPDEIVKKVLEESLRTIRSNNTAPSHSIIDSENNREEKPAKEETKNIVKMAKQKENNIKVTSQEAPKPISALKIDDTEKFIQNLVCTSGAKAGVKYKVEVTSPLAVDGTFWASNVEIAFFNDKLEPLSDKLRTATQNDRSLWVVDDTKKLVCVKSAHNGLWLRAKVVKELNPSSIRVQFVDLGQTEDCPKSRLSKLPPEYETIPYMAFHCTLSEEKIKVQYETKWKFSDLVKKKVLNFTVQKLLPHGDEKLVFGKLETILDSPPVVVNEQIIPGCLGMQSVADPKDIGKIASRDIRVHDNDRGMELSSVSEIIRNNSISNDEKSPRSDVGAPEASLKKSPARAPPPLSPIKIPDQSDTEELGWGDSKTPGADERMHLSPLDDRLFDSPTDSMEEAQLKQELARTNSSDAQPNELVGFEEVLKQLHQQRNALIQNMHSAEQKQILQNVDSKLMWIYTQMNMIPASMLPLSSDTTRPPMISNQHFPQQVSMSPHLFNPPQPICTKPHRPVYNAPLLSTQPPLAPTSDFAIKMQQLDAITRCLQSPNEALDEVHLHNLHITRDRLQTQLYEEDARKAQIEAMLHQQQRQQDQAPPVPQSSPSITGQLQHLNRMRENLLAQSSDSIETGLSEGSDVLDEINKKTEEFRPQTISPLVQVEASMTGPKEAFSGNPTSNISNDCAIEITHTSNFDAKPKRKCFAVPSIETVRSESKSSWITRELSNLENSLLTDSKAKFYSVVINEMRGRFIPNLEITYSTGDLLLTDIDGQIFQKEWQNVSGPIFIISRYKLLDCTWMVGGIMEVVSKKIERRTNVMKKSSLSYMCRVNLVSTAVVNDLPWFRSEKYTREITKDVVLRYLQLIISRLQEGKCTTIFRFQDQRLKQQPQQSYLNNSSSFTSSSNHQQIQEKALETTNPSTSPNQEGFKVPPSSSYFSNSPIDDNSNALAKSTRPMNVIIPESEENWDLELNSPIRAVNMDKLPVPVAGSGEDLGSGDEGERDVNTEIEVFGLSKEDL